MYISIINKEKFNEYSMHLFGIIAFFSTFSLGMIALLKQDFELIKYVPYGIILFIVNIVYLKLMRLSRDDYEKKLSKEKEYSQSLLDAKKLFLRYTVHETNTPLAVIMANIELYELQSGKHPLLSNIEAATKNIYTIYDDLNYLTKKNKVHLKKTKLILLEMIKSRLQFFNIVAEQSCLSFEIHGHSTSSAIYINETKLQRIIDNNISNALKYTKEFEVIHIIIFEEGENCVFEISSYSSIIRDPRKIFDAYYREELTKEGLGLGLNLVKEICNEENIKIELTSKKNITSFKYSFKKVST